MRVSRHAEERLKQRFGIKKRAVKKYAEKAFQEGVFPKDYRVRVIGMKFMLLQEKRPDVMYIFYRDMLHVFSIGLDKVPVLVTVYDPLLQDEKDYYVAGELRREDKSATLEMV